MDKFLNKNELKLLIIINVYYPKYSRRGTLEKVVLSSNMVFEKSVTANYNTLFLRIDSIE